MPTKDELEQENAELRAQLEEAQAAAAAAAERSAGDPEDGPRRPQRPMDDNGKPVLSAGEKSDLEQRGVTISPFTGETLNAIDEGVETQTKEAGRRAREVHEKRVRDEGRPAVSESVGPPPATDE
jgi:hypothetical protein